jgi:pimeloyl-ACP methyl ester carboxylesterase
VVLIHAGVADRAMWDEHLGWLARAGFRAVAVDLPGFGEAPATQARTPIGRTSLARCAIWKSIAQRW